MILSQTKVLMIDPIGQRAPSLLDTDNRLDYYLISLFILSLNATARV